MLKVSPYYIYIMYRTVLGRTDFVQSESEWFYRDGPFTNNVSFGGHEKNVIYSKLVNNPFKEIKRLRD